MTLGFDFSLQPPPKGVAMHKRRLGQCLDVSALGLGCMGMSFAYGPAPDGARDDRADPRRGRARRHLLRHRRSLRPVHQRRDGGRGAGTGPRPGGDRHQVRLRLHPATRPARRLEQSARAHQASGGGVAASGCAPMRSTSSTSTASIPDVPIEEVAGAVKELIAEGKVQPLRPLGGGRRRRSAGRTRCSLWRRSRASIRCGGASRRRR